MILGAALVEEILSVAVDYAALERKRMDGLDEEGRRTLPWTKADCFGGIAIQHNGEDQALIAIDGRTAQRRASEIARRMVRLLNAGEAALNLTESGDGVSP